MIKLFEKLFGSIKDDASANQPEQKDPVKLVCVQNFRSGSNDYKVGDIVEAKTLEEERQYRRMNTNATIWVDLDEKNIAYFDIEGDEPIQRLKERLRNNIVPVDGFDYPFSISRCKLSQEDYCVIMGVDHFYHEKEPVGADCPYVTNQWDQYVTRYKEGQNRGEIMTILKKLEEITGRSFRLPTIKECEFINNVKEGELGFSLNNELCEVGGGFLCTETKGIYVSDPRWNDLAPYKSIRLVECDKPLSEIDFADEEVINKIRHIFAEESDGMHYYWEN